MNRLPFPRTLLPWLACCGTLTAGACSSTSAPVPAEPCDCGGGEVLDAAADGIAREPSAIADAASQACTWPASLDKQNVTSTACYAAPTYDICITEDAGNTVCGINACKPDEYAVFCGGPGPAAPPPLPTGCRAAVSGPGGNNAGCCPCAESRAEAGKA